VFCVLLMWSLATSMMHQQWKVSKAMRSTLKVEEEMFVDKEKLMADVKNKQEKEIKLRNLKTKPIQELRHIFYPAYEAETTAGLKRHPPLQVFQKECRSEGPMWDLVGENQTWDVVFVDHLPMEKRTTAAARLLKRTKLLIIHDTENFSFNNKMNLPKDFMYVK